MKTKTVKRHYCDHCGKGGQSSYCIRRHETTCIRNPQRACPACSKQRVSGMLMATHETVASLIESFKAGGLPALRDKAEGCPACMLAAIVQSRPRKSRPSDEDYDWVDFDYKKEMAEWNTEQLPAVNC